MPPGPRGLEKIEIREGEMRSEAAKEIDVKVAPFVHPLPIGGRASPLAEGQHSQGLDSFLAIGEKGAPDREAQKPTNASDLRAQQIIAQFKQADSFQGRWPAQPIEWNNPTVRGIANFLSKAFEFLLQGGAGFGGPLMIFGGLLFQGKPLKVATAEDFSSRLQAYNEILQGFDEAKVLKQTGEKLTPDQEILLANSDFEALSQERSHFVQANEQYLAPQSGEVSSNIEVSDLFLGQVIDGRYKIQDVIGIGGMGIVYRCVHQIIGKTFAIKVLRPEHSSNQEAAHRFLNEARAASAIGNKHIIHVSDAGRLPNGTTYLVMEHLEGLPLSRLLDKEGAVSEEKIIHVGEQLAEGLAAAHKKNIVHRDLKPDNIFLTTEGQDKEFVKILDFGIAKILSTGGKRITQAGVTFGTPEYMPPEQAMGEVTDGRSDIYSFGIVLYEMATGKVPFQSEDIPSLLSMQIQKVPPSIREANPLITPELEAIIFKCLAKKPKDRYQSMEEIIADLDKIKSKPKHPIGLEKLQVNDTEAVRPLTPPRSRLALYAGLGAAGLTGLFAAFLALRETDSSAPRKSVPTDANEAPLPDASPRSQITVTPLDPPPPKIPVKKRIELTVEPRDAHIFQGNKDLGTGRVVVEVEEGAPMELEIRRKGFKTKKLPLDVSQEKKSVRLEREKTPPNKPKPPPDKPKKPGKNDLVNPFKL